MIYLESKALPLRQPLVVFMSSELGRYPRYQVPKVSVLGVKAPRLETAHPHVY